MSNAGRIVVFVTVATAIYGCLHAYLWWKATRQLGLRGTPAFGLALFFAAMVALPFVGRMLRDGSALLNAVELVTFVWMGLAFYLLVLNLGADLWNLAAAISRLPATARGLPRLAGPPLFWAITAAAALIVSWAAVDAENIRIRRLTVPTAKLAPGTPPLRIVQVSDLHIGLLIGPRRLGRMLERVREARPDVLVATGDMLDAVGEHLDPLAAMWQGITPRLGKFAVTGNHEYFSGIPGAIAFHEHAGFRLLRDETAIIPGVLNLIGVEYRGRQALPGPRPALRPLAELVRECDPALFRLELKHLPTGFEEEAAPLGVDLQLSGHTHDGQLWPFRWIVGIFFRHLAGITRAGDSLLYVSRGTGTWGPPLRFLAPPEVTLIELVPASHDGPSAAVRPLPPQACRVAGSATGTSPSRHSLVARLASGPSCEASP